jgi:hypothetical protein
MEKAAKSSSNTVTVACKIPNGLILQLQRIEEFDIPVLGGGKSTEKRYIPHGNRVHINGPAKALFGVSDHRLRVSGGYALTHNVDKDFFDAWLEQNAELDLVRKKMIFCHEKADYADRKAEDQAEIKSGLEPIDPDNLPKLGKLKIETATKEAA